MAAPLSRQCFRRKKLINPSFVEALGSLTYAKYRHCTLICKAKEKLERHWTAKGHFDKTIGYLPTSHPLSFNQHYRSLHSHAYGDKKKLVLGIETSCDDTGAAIVDQNGQIIAESLNSQTRIHVEMGGIQPPLARDLHVKNISQVVESTLAAAGVSLADLTAIAATVKPGLPMSLEVGFEYAKQLIEKSRKPFIPIHHMEAHALTVRMIEKVEFPYLVLLISGGHCLLAVAKDVDEFILIGKGLDDAPGDAFDKTARRLKLKNLPQCDGLSGGASIELIAKDGNPRAFDFKPVMWKYANCNFSFSGIKNMALRFAQKEEEKYDIKGGRVIPTVADVCANFQYMVLHHLAKRVQRGLLFCDAKGLLPPTRRTLVISGGVGSNLFIRQGLEKMCAEYDCDVVCPPPKLCTDNGIMIAWNGMEKLKAGRGIADINETEIQHRCPLGEDISEEVAKLEIKLPRVKVI